ncbi:MAG: undecaprenyl-phosphate glucose phosphotransferase [Caldilineaceae bacterium]|nr:undecaprenyl-phosphate glucose phosphotransferase [Caldilineaceae bacterium]MBP8110532.1 undecaprenyl-phosphate glucose phosphotransferase [Caldilineaceae bacterium]MBP8123192.1 undecaprenyl-phosphate glucose phosphotransferase [Caldilineaceae bacterium]MBP9072414.1 undecaprenyl-phosphate glucose phosphotransferase [Caldilineaceae bacterium]
MQQSITTPPSSPPSSPPVVERTGSRRLNRPGILKRPQWLFMMLLMLIDVGSIWLGYGLAYVWLTRQSSVGMGVWSDLLPLPILEAVLLLFIFFVQRMYQRRRPVSHLDESYKIGRLVTLAVLLTLALVALFLPDFFYRRNLVVYAWGISVIVLVLARAIHAQAQWQAQARGIGDDRVLLIGAGEVGQMILQKILNTPKLGFQVVGIVDNSNLRRLMDVPVLGGYADIPQIIEQYGVDEVIIGLPESSHQEIVGIISLCEREKVGIRVFPDVFQIMASEVSIGDLGGLPLLTVRDVALQGWKLTLKRAVDVVGSGIGMVMVSPFMLMTAILIKLESPGPVFYTQERMGLDARPFKIIKFRSMRADAEASGPGWTTEDDPRRTKLGSLLRRFEVDELPQLINVLIGDMSLVGPRPERPVYVEQFRQRIPRYMDRHREKAGMTGWAQVNGMRGDTSIAERTKYDLWYIENWSLSLDFKIIIRTVVQTVFSANDNAY